MEYKDDDMSAGSDRGYEMNIDEISQGLKMMIDKQENEIKEALKSDGLPEDLKFGDFEIELDTGAYKISTILYADDEDEEIAQGNRKELLFYAKELNILSKLCFKTYDTKELSEIIQYRKEELEKLEYEFKKGEKNEN